MAEIRTVNPGKIRGYPYPVCKKKIVSPREPRGYPRCATKNFPAPLKKNKLCLIGKKKK